MKPETIIAGDADILGGGQGGGGGGGSALAFVNGGNGGVSANDPNWNIFLGSSIDVSFGAKLHDSAGNAALSDGSVHQYNNTAYREQIFLILTSCTNQLFFSLPKSL